MTEKEFWVFLNGKFEEGRQEQVSLVMDSDDPQIKAAGKYIGGHSLLPKGYDEIPATKIFDMGKLLLGGQAKALTKEAILVILAHIPSKDALNILKAYNESPDAELKYFAQMALEECEMWNEQ